MNRKTLLAALVSVMSGLIAVQAQTIHDPVELVNPLMGTHSTVSYSTGNTLPLVGTPWGMNYWTPTTRDGGWAYTYMDNKIRGFKQTHQPSPWIGDYGQFSIMPFVGTIELDADKRASWFSHKAEQARPHYYKVYLADHDIVTEITPTSRAAIFRFTFPQSDSSFVAIDAMDMGSYIKIVPDKNRIVGYNTKNSSGVPDNFRNYFVIDFDRPFAYEYTFNGDALSTLDEQQADHTGAIIGFRTRRGEQITARVASSFISHEQALRNLEEVSGKEFETVKSEAKTAWNDVLGRIAIEGGDLDQQRTFYSCLYRTSLFPRTFYEIDANGQPIHYSPYNGEVLPGYMYTDTGFWDTFRSLFPLLNILQPTLNGQIQEGLINTYKESGFFPEWASPGHRGCMVGNNSASVLVDAYMKGVKVKDLETLYLGLLNGADSVHPTVSSTGRLGHEYYNTLGYVPYDVKINESAARTLEYAYNDWCIYTIAKELGRPQAEIDLFRSRAMNYKKLFDPETRLMRGRNRDGSFMTPFSPLKWGDAFTEGNAWHYTWSVFHDPQGLIELMGGRKDFVQMLDSVFSVPPKFDYSYYGAVIHEIREMQIMNMGNYAHGNQPIQHMIYLYNYAGEPWKTQHWVREVMDRMYNPNPDGYCGDEDNGQTSAWYIFSAMGFYPVCPGSTQYVLGAPLFKKSTITLENGKKLTIEAPANSPANRYVKSLTINGKPYTKNYIDHKTIMNGGRIVFEMSDVPNKTRGTQAADMPYSLSTEGGR